MERIKFYSNIDMSTSYNFNKALEFIKTISNKDYSINEILEFYNIVKLFNPEYLKNCRKDIKDICKDSSKKLKAIIGKYCSNINGENIEKYLEDVEKLYIEDFFELIDKYKIYERIDEKKFNEIIAKKDYYLHIVLHHKNIVFKYDKIIREKLLNYSDSAELLLDEYESEHITDKIPRIFPESLTNDDKNQILLNYINNEFSNLNYLRLIMNFQSTNELVVSDKIKLLAKKKAEMQQEKLFENSCGIEMSTLVQFKENMHETVVYNIKERNWEFYYDINWISENKDDNSTLLNNFIYLFDYVDNQMRWNLVSKSNLMGIFEKHLFMSYKIDYEI